MSAKKIMATIWIQAQQGLGGASRAIVQAPLRRTFTACGRHQGDLVVDMLTAFAGVRERLPRRKEVVA